MASTRSGEDSYRRSRSGSPEFDRKKPRSRSRSQERRPSQRDRRARSRSLPRRNERNRSRSSSRRHHAKRSPSRSRSPLNVKSSYHDEDRRRRSHSSSSEATRKQGKKEKKAKKDKKKHKRHVNHKAEDGDAPGSALAQQDDSFSERQRRQASPAESPPVFVPPKDPAVSLTASNNVMSFFAQLKQQEASKGPVGTLHASGVKAPLATGVVEGWECAKPGCGHRNSKYAGSCNKCGAMKRMSEWR